jgi:hypothetical protein
MGVGDDPDSLSRRPQTVTKPRREPTENIVGSDATENQGLTVPLEEPWTESMPDVHL